MLRLTKAVMPTYLIAPSGAEHSCVSVRCSDGSKSDSLATLTVRIRHDGTMLADCSELYQMLHILPDQIRRYRTKRYCSRDTQDVR